MFYYITIKLLLLVYLIVEGKGVAAVIYVGCIYNDTRDWSLNIILL